MIYIFLAWPAAGFTWVLFLGEIFVADIRTLLAADGKAAAAPEARHDLKGHQ